MTRRSASSGPPRLCLRAQEQANFKALAERLAKTPPGLIDNPDWLAEARDSCCQLPVRLLEAVRQYRHDPGSSGVLILEGLPAGTEADLPPTPTVLGSAEKDATVAASCAVLAALQLGEIIAYRQEKSGHLVHNVVPVAGEERSQSNAGSAPQELHVENAFHAHRPDYVVMLALRSARQHSAGTRVSSVREALPLLSEADRELLRQPRFTTASPPSFGSREATSPHPVLCGDHDDPDVTVDFAATTALDADARRSMSRLREAFAATAHVLALDAGEMIMVDNRVVVHGRAPFAPRYDGRDRWLHRTYVSLDNRRTRAYRRGNGSVLD